MKLLVSCPQQRGSVPGPVFSTNQECFTHFLIAEDLQFQLGLRCTMPFLVSHLWFCAKLLSVSLIVHGQQPCLLQRGKEGFNPFKLLAQVFVHIRFQHRYLCTQISMYRSCLPQSLTWEPSLWYRSSCHLKDIGSTELRVSLCSVQGYLMWSLLLYCPGMQKRAPLQKIFDHRQQK